MTMPEPLSSGELDRWIAVLELGADGGKKLRDTVETFFTERSPDIKQAVEPVARAARDLATRSVDVMRLPDGPEAFRELLKKRDRAVARLVAIEEDLFTAVATAVAPDAPDPVADTIRQLRKRSRFAGTPPKLPMATVDLRTIEERLSRAAPFSIVDRDAWRARRLSYDAELAAIEERRVRLELELILDDLESFRDSGYDVDALVAFRTKQNRRRLSVERSMIAANNRWSEVFCEMMSAADAHRWREAVRAETYPALYPNPLDLRQIAVVVRDLAKTDAEVGPIATTIDGELEKLAGLESAAETMLVDLAADEARSLISPDARRRTDERVALLKRERHAAALRVVDACTGHPALAADPEFQRLAAAVKRERGEGSSGEAGTPAAKPIGPGR